MAAPSLSAGWQCHGAGRAHLLPQLPTGHSRHGPCRSSISGRLEGEESRSASFMEVSPGSPPRGVLRHFLIHAGNDPKPGNPAPEFSVHPGCPCGHTAPQGQATPRPALNRDWRGS